MSRWVCPACDREFQVAGQSHVCVPGGTVEDTFAGRPPGQYACYRALLDHVEEIGPVHADAVRVGVFLKAERKFAELRPMARSLHVYFVLPRRVRDERITRVFPGAGRVWHVVQLREPDEIDDTLLGWLAEAYLESGGGD
jgi:hypothetical protein